MWICRSCNIKHGDGAKTCIGCGGKKEDVGAVIDLTGKSFQAAKPNMKTKVKPLFAAIFILMVPVLIYLKFSGELGKEDQQWERSQLERAVVRVDSALDQKERQKEEKDQAGDQDQKADYAKVLVIDSAQIVLKCLSQEEMNEYSLFLIKGHEKTLTETEIIKMETLLASKSAQLSDEENGKITMLVTLVKLINSSSPKPSKEQRDSLFQDIKGLYKNKPLEKGKSDVSRISQGMGLEAKLSFIVVRLAIKYLSESEASELGSILNKLASLTRAEKEKVKTLLQKIQEKCGQDEKFVLSAFQKMIAGLV